MDRQNGSGNKHVVETVGGRSQNPCVILVVDDDPAMMSLLKDELSDEGCTVLPAYNGLEALSQLQRERPNLIVTDLHMKFGGMEFLTKLKSAYPSCPIIVMTAFGDAQTKATVLKAGMAGYFDKPVRMGDLKALMCRICHLPMCFQRKQVESVSPKS